MVSSSGETEAWAERLDPQCVAPDLAAARLAALPWRRFAVLGDSLAAGILIDSPGYRSQAFASRLIEALSATRPDFNALSLATPYALLEEIRDEQVRAAASFKPDAFLLSVGRSDVIRGTELGAFTESLEETVVELAAGGATPILVSLSGLARSGMVAPKAAKAMAKRFEEADRAARAATDLARGVFVEIERSRVPAQSSASLGGGHPTAKIHAVIFAALVRALDSRALASRESRFRSAC